MTQVQPNPTSYNSDWLAPRLTAAAKKLVLPEGDIVIDKPLPQVPKGKRIESAGKTRIFTSYQVADGNTAAIFDCPHDDVFIGNGIEFWNPEITDQTPDVSLLKKYPWAIRMDGNYCRIEDVRLGNLPLGAKFCSGNGSIENLRGACLLNDLLLDTNGHTVSVHELRLNEPWYDHWYDSPLVNWMYQNRVNVYIGRVDEFRGQDWQTAHGKWGLIIDKTQAPVWWQGSGCGRINGFGNECTNFFKINRVDADNSGWVGGTITIENGYHAGGGKESAVVIKGDVPATVWMTNIDFALLPDPGVQNGIIACENARLFLSNVNYGPANEPQQGHRQLFLRMTKGQLNVTGGHIAGVPGQTAAIIEKGVTSEIWCGVGGVKGRLKSSCTNRAEIGTTLPQ